ncbi:hypothetical protein B0J14DRAFT_703444 [Halenospora varia]|nr:hypothetical protein B0J14DRAFT_703444 [Halenospora varia]
MAAPIHTTIKQQMNHWRKQKLAAAAAQSARASGSNATPVAPRRNNGTPFTLAGGSSQKSSATVARSRSRSCGRSRRRSRSPPARSSAPVRPAAVVAPPPPAQAPAQAAAPAPTLPGPTQFIVNDPMDCSEDYEGFGTLGFYVFPVKLHTGIIVPTLVDDPMDMEEDYEGFGTLGSCDPAVTASWNL